MITAVGTGPSLPSPYAGRQIALLTRHRKERVIAPLAQRRLAAELQLDDGYDTDQLGTFTREIPRLLDQRDAAARKARLAIERTGIPLGMGSEGAFGPDPVIGLSPWNVELLVLVDAERDIEVIGIDQGPANFAHLVTADWAAVEAFAHEHGFPRQHLVVRPQREDDPRLRKDISSWSTLSSAFSWAQDLANNDQIVVETDGRAFANPDRMARIERAAEDLFSRLLSCCPACGTPGFGRIERVSGLPCAACGAPTWETCADIHGCLKCTHRARLPVAHRPYADPAHCDECNP
jgi:hypothetical protein